MALRGIQEYIARDANNIARDANNIAGVEALRAMYSCFPRKRAIQYYYSHRALSVILLSYDRE